MLIAPPMRRAALLRCRDASILCNACPDAAVAVVAAGPSLLGTIDRIKSYDLIFAVLRAAPILLGAGISPHLVVAAGFRGYYTPGPLPRSPCLVDLRTHADVWVNLPEPKLLALTEWDIAISRTGPMISGASSALAALDTAALIGADPIALFGWDILHSPPGTPGRDEHRDGVRRISKSGRRIDARGPARRKKTRQEAARKLRDLIQISRRPAWLDRIKDLGRSPDKWEPFFGPDYRDIGIKGPLIRQFIRMQQNEKRRFQKLLARRGFI